MPLVSLNAKLDRTDQGTSWGFRLHGGHDFGAPLTIQRVTPGSLAANCGLQAGDAIAKIGDTPTDGMRHKDAQQTIMRCGNSLELTLQRGNGDLPRANNAYSTPSYTSPAPSSAFSPVQPPTGNSGYQQNYNMAPKPFQGAHDDQDATVPVALNKQYNTPIQMYSVGNVMDSLATQTGSMNLGQPASGSTPPHPSVSGASTFGTGTGFGTHAKSDTCDHVVSNARHDSPSSATATTTTTTTTTTTATNNNSLVPGHRSTLAATKTSPSPSQFSVPEGRHSPRYYGVDDPPAPAPQSRSFRLLQSMVDSAEDVAVPSLASHSRQDSGPKQPQTTDTDEDPKYVKAIVNKQYNTPIGLYSGSNVQTTFESQSSNILASLPRTNDEEIVAQERKKICIPSKTYKMVQEQDKKGPDNLDGDKKLQGSAPAAPSSYGAPSKPGGGGGTWQPKVPTGTRQPKLGRKGEAKSMGPAVGRQAVCGACGTQIRGPFVSAVNKTWCPDCFVCANPNCRVSLINMGFVEENGQLFCERDYEQYLAPRCGKCGRAIVGEIVSAMQHSYHPQCFLCAQCHKAIGTSTFHAENGQFYCDKDWAAMFQTKCYGCQFPIESGDRWVEALNQNWHSECFNCSTCQVNLEGASFFAKGGRPYCKKHAGSRRF